MPLKHFSTQVSETLIRMRKKDPTVTLEEAREVVRQKRAKPRRDFSTARSGCSSIKINYPKSSRKGAKTSIQRKKKSVK